MKLRKLFHFAGNLTAVLCGFILFGASPKSMFVLLGVFGVAAAQLLPSLNRLSQALVQIKYGMPALKTIYDELQQVKETELEALLAKKNIGSAKFSHMININNLHYAYQDGTVALNGVNIEIHKNKKIAFVGESGAGKTTLVDLLMGLYTPSKGQVSLDGKAVVSESEVLSFQRLFS